MNRTIIQFYCRVNIITCNCKVLKKKRTFSLYAKTCMHLFSSLCSWNNPLNSILAHVNVCGTYNYIYLTKQYAHDKLTLEVGTHPLVPHRQSIKEDCPYILFNISVVMNLSIAKHSFKVKFNSNCWAEMERGYCAFNALYWIQNCNLSISFMNLRSKMFCSHIVALK